MMGLRRWCSSSKGFFSQVPAVNLPRCIYFPLPKQSMYMVYLPTWKPYFTMKNNHFYVGKLYRASPMDLLGIMFSSFVGTSADVFPKALGAPVFRSWRGRGERHDDTAGVRYVGTFKILVGRLLGDDLGETEKPTALRISWDPPKKRGLDVKPAGFWDLQFLPVTWDPMILRVGWFNQNSRGGGNSNIFLFFSPHTPEKWSNLIQFDDNIFQMAWNH